MMGYSINSGISGLLQSLLSPESPHHAAELLARELLVPPAARVDQEAPVYVVPRHAPGPFAGVGESHTSSSRVMISLFPGSTLYETRTPSASNDFSGINHHWSNSQRELTRYVAPSFEYSPNISLFSFISFSPADSCSPQSGSSTLPARPAYTLLARPISPHAGCTGWPSET